MMQNQPFIDRNNRVINYLRLSVTDRCNLRCIYCMPEDGIDFVPHEEILSYEEILHIVRLCAQGGIRKVRVTGGEPFVRKGFIDLLRGLNGVRGIEETTITTNGVMLAEHIGDLKACGVHRINISLDSMKRDRFRHITGRDYFDRVIEGIREAERQGLNPIKINVVVMRGINDDEVRDFASLTLEKPYHIRFIEFMPVGRVNGWSEDRFISIDEIKARIEGVGVLQRTGKGSLDGPARRFRLSGARGEIGFIGALSHHFCDVCNRLRLTAEGHLRGCLFSDQEQDIKTPLRRGKGDDYLLKVIREAIQDKPKGHGFHRHGARKCVRQMSSIGG